MSHKKVTKASGEHISFADRLHIWNHECPDSRDKDLGRLFATDMIGTQYQAVYSYTLSEEDRHGLPTKNIAGGLGVEAHRVIPSKFKFS